MPSGCAALTSPVWRIRVRTVFKSPFIAASTSAGSASTATTLAAAKTTAAKRRLRALVDMVCVSLPRGKNDTRISVLS
jgi:hypothetical protein